MRPDQTLRTGMSKGVKDGVKYVSFTLAFVIMLGDFSSGMRFSDLVMIFPVSIRIGYYAPHARNAWFA